MKEKKPFYKRWWFWVIIVVVVIAMISPKTDNQTDNQETAVVSSSEVSADTPAAASSSEDPLENVMVSEHEDFKGLTTTDNGYQISYKSTSSLWDENTFVTECIRNYVNLSKQIYIDNPDLEYVYCYVFVDMTDSKGNVSSSKGMSIKMTKAEFNTYNWDNLEYAKIYEQFKESCEDFFIAPGIEKNIDTDKIYYY